MHLNEYQRDIANEPRPSVMEQAKMLARHLRFLTVMAQGIGYSLEELASLDKEEG